MALNPQNLQKGRNEKNKPKKFWEYIGEDNFSSLIEMHLKTALYSDNESLRCGAREYIIDKIVPKPSPATFVKISVKDMKTIEDIKEYELYIHKKVGEGEISVEISEKLLSNTEKLRKTFEVTEIAERVALMESRLISKGI